MFFDFTMDSIKIYPDLKLKNDTNDNNARPFIC